MKLHTFLEYDKGNYTIIKKFLHFDGFDESVKEEYKDEERLFYSVNYFVILCKDSKTMNKVAYKYAKENNLSLIESYNDCEVRFSNVTEITAVNNMDKTNEGFNGFLSNFMYAFIYPKKYQDYKIFKLDVMVSHKDKYYNLIDYSINENRDEIIYSHNKEIKNQILQN